jgi:hypothetical protein
LSDHNIEFSQEQIKKIEEEFENMEKNGINLELSFRIEKKEQMKYDKNKINLEEYSEDNLIDIENCIIEGNGNSCVAGREATFKIITRDKNGKILKSGGEKISCFMKNDRESVDVQVTDLNNGTYECKYIVKESGIYKVDIGKIPNLY